jgi:hypothetical protein
MHPYAKTISQPHPDSRIQLGCPTPLTSVRDENSSLYSFDERTGKKVANSFRPRAGLKTSPDQRESDFPVSYKADEK